MDVKIKIYKTTIFENRVLRRIFGSKKDEATEIWRNLHSEEDHIFISLQIRMVNSRRLRWPAHIELTAWLLLLAVFTNMSAPCFCGNFSDILATRVLRSTHCRRL
jgi:hypothetical protein